jgi:ABC-type nickel/cobalt efflux system permease component RcnA
MIKRFTLFALALCSVTGAFAHPLGIFSINRYTRLELRRGEITLHYVMDVAEIPATQEIRSIDRNHDGVPDESECSEYSRKKIAELIQGMTVSIDGAPVLLRPGPYDISFPPGQGGLRTLRLSFKLEGAARADSADHLLTFQDLNFAGGRGWKEIVATAASGSMILRSTVPESDMTNELRSYPAGSLEDPLSVSFADVRFGVGTRGTGGVAASSSIGAGFIVRAKDSFAELVSARELSLPVILFSLLVAMFLGAGHALTPGHGKTVVAAYLVGSRGTARHAAFLGLTVTATHTVGVFALGFIAMFASQYILPGDLYPWLSLASGLIVVFIGVSLLTTRIRAARGNHPQDGHPHSHAHSHAHTDGESDHVHGPGTHSHLPPGVDGSPVTWKKLAALGISGGLLPCPSALVVLLSAIALGRIGFGLLLIVAFSAGLAGVLTGIGLLMVHAKRLFERFSPTGPVLLWLPVFSALVVSLIGVVMSIQAAGLTGIAGLISTASLSGMLGTASFSILALGFTLGLKHALDADHLVAVSTIVSGRRGILGSSIVGGLWGLGHTLSLVAVGLLVIALHIQIPEKVAMGMEFTVALMLVILGLNVLRSMRKGHTHSHAHGGVSHVHPHAHDHEESHLRTAGTAPLKEGLTGGKRSVFIGMVHGLAGSAALMLVVLTTIPSAGLAMSYIAIFGLGSVGGMMLMSTLLGLPFALTARKFESLNSVIRGVSGAVSVGFGLFLVWQIGITQGLFL